MKKVTESWKSMVYLRKNPQSSAVEAESASKNFFPGLCGSSRGQLQPCFCWIWICSSLDNYLQFFISLFYVVLGPHLPYESGFHGPENTVVLGEKQRV